jgi:hypothetical protein
MWDSEETGAMSRPALNAAGRPSFGLKGSLGRHSVVVSLSSLGTVDSVVAPAVTRSSLGRHSGARASEYERVTIDDSRSSLAPSRHWARYY